MKTQSIHYEDITEVLNQALKDHKLILIGKVGLWNGTRLAYRHIFNAYDIFSDSIDNYQVCLSENNNLEIKMYHHDGRHYFDLMAIRKNVNNEKLEEYLNDYIQTGIGNIYSLLKNFNFKQASKDIYGVSILNKEPSELIFDYNDEYREDNIAA